MTTEAPSAPEPDVLTVGSPSEGRRGRRLLVVAALVLLLGVTGVGIHRLLPRANPPMTSEELQGVYAGMVRSDGTNDASLLERRNVEVADVVVDPTECAPLFDTTVFNQLPAEALDGMSTYWLTGSTAISLFTLRFDDESVARTAYARVDDALASCRDRTVTVGDRRPLTGPVSPTAVDTANGIADQLGYVLTSNPASGSPAIYAVHVLRLDNTVTWQFRYEPQAGPYAPQSAQQLMDGLVAQIRGVQALRPR